MLCLGQVVTSPAGLKAFDLYQVTLEDMTFTSPFTLQAHRADYVHALVVYFGVQFMRCHTPLGFSTGPDSHFTHWKQTMFYLKDFILIHKNEIIKGNLTAKPNLLSRRDLDVNIVISFKGKLGTLYEDNHYKVR